MPKIFSKKSNILWIAFIVVGLLVIVAMFVYYGLHLGIKPCKGLPSDAANCGDADFGGVIFIMVGVPLTAFGIVALGVSLAVDYIQRRKR